VGNPPANQPPTVQAAADPASGTAPVTVRFSASARDPEGGALMYEWSFGDGGAAGGASASHTYGAPGTYTATVTVTDPRGATASDSVQVVVSAAQAQNNAAAAPDPVTWFGLNKPARTSLSKFMRRGLKVQVTCTDAMGGSAALKVTRRQARKLDLGGTTIARRSIECSGPGTESVTLKPSKRVRRALADASGSVKMRLDVRMRTAGAAGKSATQRLTLRRR
jgi:PKD repeat protein